MKAIVFAAGLGTRLKPLTDTMPKALVPIAGKPLLEHVMTKLIASGFDEVIINVHHFADQIIDYLAQKNNFGIRIAISDERNMLLETGGGIKKAADFFDDGQPFLVHNVDILSNVDLNALYKTHLSSNAFATLLVSERVTNRYLLFDDNNTLKAWKNESTNELKTPCANLDISCLHKYAFSGIHIISPSLLAQMDGWDGKFSIIDFYLSIADRMDVKAYVSDNLKLIDVGKLNSIDEAEKMIVELGVN